MKKVLALLMVAGMFSLVACGPSEEEKAAAEAEAQKIADDLMKGLEGNADANKDKKLTNGELIDYLKNNVSQEAFTQNRSQEPMLAGDPDKILMSYR